MSCLVATANAAPFDDAVAAVAAHGRGDYAQALKIFRSLAAQGNAPAQYNIGYMYSNGQGVTQSYQEALKWYRLAADQGFASAQSNLGNMYDTGQGVTQDYQEAVKWYRLAAAQGNAGAQFNIGLMYDNGKGVTQSYREALKWYRLAADQGVASAQYNVGAMYYYGQVVTTNYQEALKWYRLSADQGHADAIESLKLPNMIAAARNSTPDRRSISIKTGTQQEEQVSIKTNRKTEQPRRTATRTETPERVSPPKLVFNSSAPNSDGAIELSGRVISDASISEISINGRLLEVSLAKDGSFRVARRLPMGATTYRLSVVDEFDQKADATVTVERAATQYVEQVAVLDSHKIKAKVNPNAVALIIGVETYSNLPPAQYADSDANHFYNYELLAKPISK